ncbi:MAG: toll/interleukin-1 receptor domain-containing protein [Pseudomonadota bacterium]
MTKIFISYRRGDTRWPAQQISRAIKKRAHDAEIFMDVDSIPPGVDFFDFISEEMKSCDIVLVLIGQHWLNSKLSNDAHRLDMPGDFVRLEIKAALERDVPVVPVLIDGTQMPEESQLPGDISGLGRRNAEAVNQITFETDVARLLNKLGIGAPNPEHSEKKSRKRGLMLVTTALMLSGVSAWALTSTERPPLIGDLLDYSGITSSTEMPSRVVDDPTLFEVGSEPETDDPITNQKVKLCDQLAAHHLDTTRPFEIAGTTFTQLRAHSKQAVRACRDAVTATPNSPRMNFNMYRALLADNRRGLAEEYREKALELGHLRALMGWGLEVMDGQSADQDFDKAIAIFEVARDLGETTGKSFFGNFAYSGIREPIDHGKAFAIFKAGGLEGYSRAQYNVGVMQKHGIGTKPEEQLSFFTFSTAVQDPATAPLAHTQMGWMLENGIGTQKDLDKAIEAYEKGRAYGHRLSSLALARMNILGIGMEPDVTAGKRLLDEVTSTEYYSLQEDVLWNYIPNPDFYEIAQVSISGIKSAGMTYSDADLLEYAETLSDAFEKRELPMHESIDCIDPDDTKNVSWCIGYWDDKPISPM